MNEPYFTHKMSKLTVELQNEICTRIAQGMNKSDACAAVGIHRQTLHNWLRKGAAKEAEQYTDFYNAYQTAHRTAVQSSYQQLVQRVLEGDVQVRTEQDADGKVLKVVKTETRSWRSAVWLLEQRFPHLFGEAAENPPESEETEETPQQPLPNYVALSELIKRFERGNEDET